MLVIQSVSHSDEEVIRAVEQVVRAVVQFQIQASWSPKKNGKVTISVRTVAMQEKKI